MNEAKTDPGVLAAAAIATHLILQSRVVHRPEDERHLFRRLLEIINEGVR